MSFTDWMSHWISQTDEKPSIALGVVDMLLLIPALVWRGFIGKQLWNWFIPVVWHNAPHLNTMQGAGLACLLLVLRQRTVDGSPPHTARDQAVLIGVYMVIDALILLAGFGFHHWM